MRKVILFLAFIPYLISAQKEYSEGRALQFNGGLLCGITASQVHGDGIGGFNKVGLNIGTIIEIKRKGKKSIQLGIVYNQKGSRKQLAPNETGYPWRYSFTYIDIPVTISYSYELFDILVGLQPSILLAAEEDFYGDWDQTGLPLKSYDLGGVLGLRTTYGDHSQLFARVTQSILAIAPRPEATTGTLMWNNRMLNMTVEVGFTYMVSKLDK